MDKKINELKHFILPTETPNNLTTEKNLIPGVNASAKPRPTIQSEVATSQGREWQQPLDSVSKSAPEGFNDGDVLEINVMDQANVEAQAEEAAKSMTDAGLQKDQADHLIESARVLGEQTPHQPRPPLQGFLNPETPIETLRKDLRDGLQQSGASEQDIDNQVNMMFPEANDKDIQLPPPHPTE